MENTDKQRSETQQSSDQTPIYRYESSTAVDEDLHIYDVTLRDGAQTPSVSFSPTERREIADLLDDFGAQYIEAGYPAREDTERTIDPVIDITTNSTAVGLAGVDRAEIDAVLNCDLSAISVYVAGSAIHRNNRGKTDIETLCDRIESAIQYASDHGLEIRFAVVDGTRTDPDVLSTFAEVASNTGADMFGISDTVGVLTPRTARSIVESVREWTALPISIHCHDDLGMAVGNAVAAAEAGAAQIHTTVNGIGANAGNTPLESFSVAMAVQHDRELGEMAVLPELSSVVSDASGIGVSPMAPVVGENAFKYTGSPRADGVRTDPAMYEIYSPEVVGRRRMIHDQ